MTHVLNETEDGYFLNKENHSIIMKFNDNTKKTEYKIQTQLLPDPFIGNPTTAKILFLALNPSYSGNNKNKLESEDDLHKTPAFKKLIRDNLMLKKVEYPFFYLNESSTFIKSPGHKFCRKRILRQLIENENISCTHLAKSISCLQYHGYHSTKYKSLGNETIRSQEFTIESVRKFIKKNKGRDLVPIIIMRSQRLWVELIPELNDIEKNIIVLNNPRNPVISRKNMKDGQFDRIVSILKS